MKNNVYRNSKGYYDPTAGDALSHCIHDEKKGKQNMAKRSCRRSEEEDRQHDFAVKVRKMTDAQIYEDFTGREKAGYDKGYEDGMKAGKVAGFQEGQNSEDTYEIEHFIEMIETLPGIGHATMMKIKGLARKEGIIGVSEQPQG